MKSEYPPHLMAMIAFLVAPVIIGLGEAVLILYHLSVVWLRVGLLTAAAGLGVRPYAIYRTKRRARCRSDQ